MNDIETLALLSRTARAALHWSQRRAASEAGVAKISLARFESLTNNTSLVIVAKLFLAYEKAGVSLTSTADVLRIEVTYSAVELASKSIKLSRRSDYTGESK